jgi:hypothetical protein
MSHQMHGIIATYEKILNILKIKDIVQHFENKNYDDEDSYKP